MRFKTISGRLLTSIYFRRVWKSQGTVKNAQSKSAFIVANFSTPSTSTTFSPIGATSHTKHCETHYEESLSVLHSKGTEEIY